MPRLVTSITILCTLALGPVACGEAVDIALAEIASIRSSSTNMTTCGTVIDAFPDEIDPRYNLLLLNDKAVRLPVSLSAAAFPRTHELVGARVRVGGEFVRAIQGLRKFSGPILLGRTVTVLEPPPTDPFAVPPLEKLNYLYTPSELAALDPRKTTGRVLATWGGNRLALRDTYGLVINVTLARNEPLPHAGEGIEAVGYPHTDLFRINLANARWRQAGLPPSTAPADPPPCLTANAIMYNQQGKIQINSERHGETIRLRGVVRALPSEALAEKRLAVASGDFRVAVDCSTCPDAARGVTVGAEIEATGCCILETSEWSSLDVFPQATGFFVVVRAPEDLRVVRLPPWWTTRRLTILLAVLLLALVGIAGWNITLRMLVKRRGRALFEAEFGRAQSELRVSERTRLAVELHDAISQNIAGASMRVDAARNFLDSDRAKAVKCLELASSTLVSCREELRGCILDLRNRALEERDLNEGVRKTVAPHLGSTKLAVRFNVPRERISDETAHALFRILRELVSNAVHHGHAATVSVAGALDGERLSFSVTDDGCGFDPETSPGVAEGHFGLEGIGERVRRLGGEMKIESRRNKGTRIAIWIRSES